MSRGKGVGNEALASMSKLYNEGRRAGRVEGWDEAIRLLEENPIADADDLREEKERRGL